MRVVYVVLPLVLGLAVAGTLIALLASRDRTRPFVHTGPEPEARAVADALRRLGGTSFDCVAYRADVGDALEARQEARLCRDGGPILAGPVSACLCGGGAPEIESPEDPLLLEALADLGGPGPFDVDVCRTALCAGVACPDYVNLRARLCTRDGDPRYDSDTARCVCNGALPAPPAPPCVPTAAYPVLRNGAVVGEATITQTAGGFTYNVTAPDVCFQEPRLYVGATPSPTLPQYPRMPGVFPGDTWEVDIAAEADGEGPARFGLAAFAVYPPEWNHPGAPTLECGHLVYVRWSALAQPRLPGGQCPSVMAPAGWLPAETAPVEYPFTLCCAP